MKLISLTSFALLGLLASCQPTTPTDNSNPYGAPNAQTPSSNPYGAPQVNDVYDPNSAPPQPIAGVTPQYSPPAAPAYNPSVTDNVNQAGGTQHTVVSGDSLWGLAKKYNTTIEQIQVANGLTTTVIRTGESLTIPAGH